MNSRYPMTYVFGNTHIEQQRLLDQAREFQQQAHWLLDRIGIQSGWRVIDVGCGPLGILDSLSQRVGVRGEVVGLEYVPRFAEAASAEIVRLGLTNVRVIQADALTSGLARNSFDFAHERLVMVNRPNPEAILSEMVALVRDAGIVAVEEVDDASWLCYPSHPSWIFWLRYITAHLVGMAVTCSLAAAFRKCCGPLVSRMCSAKCMWTSSSRTVHDGSTFFHCSPRCTTRSSRLGCWLRMSLLCTRPQLRCTSTIQIRL